MIKENPKHNMTTVFTKRALARNIEFDKPVKPEVQLPFRDVSNSPEKGLVLSDYSRRSSQGANHSK
jgi:hypothetical protein